MSENHRIQTIEDTINEDKGHITGFCKPLTSYGNRCTEFNIGLLGI